MFYVVSGTFLPGGSNRTSETPFRSQTTPFLRFAERADDKSCPHSLWSKLRPRNPRDGFCIAVHVFSVFFFPRFTLVALSPPPPLDPPPTLRTTSNANVTRRRDISAARNISHSRRPRVIRGLRFFFSFYYCHISFAYERKPNTRPIFHIPQSSKPCVPCYHYHYRDFSADRIFSITANRARGTMRFRHVSARENSGCIKKTINFIRMEFSSKPY